jgi:N-acetylglucosaminyldiphosphoundecaprenol N-acetyl-beta-D-mannosaminyltransferase
VTTRSHGATCPSPAASVTLAGVRFDALTRDGVVDRIFADLASGRGGWLVTANVDIARLLATEPAYAATCRFATLTVADGMPLLWAARLQATPLPDRVAGSDLVWLIAERAAREARSLYLLGGNPGAAEGAAERFRARAPGLRIAGISSPHVASEPRERELSDLRAELVRTGPDVVYVALGSPKTERLIAALRPHFPATWFIGVGISLSFAAGEVRRAPRWMQRTGLEWLHRLAQEPGRLARRYLVDDTGFLLRLLASAWRARA